MGEVLSLENQVKDLEEKMEVAYSYSKEKASGVLVSLDSKLMNLGNLAWQLLGYKILFLIIVEQPQNSKQSSAKEGSIPDRPYNIIPTVLVRPSAYSLERLKYSRIQRGKLLFKEHLLLPATAFNAKAKGRFGALNAASVKANPQLKPPIRLQMSISHQPSNGFIYNGYFSKVINTQKPSPLKTLDSESTELSRELIKLSKSSYIS
ncbi:hypothetical protein OROMI_023886 [Orobanche minor]